jgi:ATP-dependent RNA helicase DeaD
MSSFKSFDLQPIIQSTLETLGFVTPTEIQEKSLPLLLASERVDFHGQAQTGTGKTLAFGIPLLNKIDKNKRATQALIVAPTRELALQISDSLRQVAIPSGISVEPIYGGMSMDEQMRLLKRGVHVVVGTPGRLNDHLRRKTLVLDQAHTLVLDEADIMLDMGFREEVDEILRFAPEDRQIWLFSATVKTGISDLIRQHMKDTVSVRVSKQQVSNQNTKQYYCVMPSRSRLQAICRFIESEPDFYGFIFCQTKILTSDVTEKLMQRGYKVGSLHGDMSQAQRNLVIKRFKQNELSIVVATDVAARGIDVANLTHVINYSMPEDHESYVHRVGRTGRAGRDGTAITFINKNDIHVMRMLQRKFNVVVDPIDVPSMDLIIKSRVKLAENYIEQLNATDNSIKLDSQLNALVGVINENNLRSVVAHLLHEKFVAVVMQDADITYASSSRSTVNEANSNAKEICISLGSDDGIERQDVVEYLTQFGKLEADNILKLRIIKRRTFVEISSDKMNGLVDSLQGELLQGKRARVNMVQEEQGERSGGDRFRRSEYRGGNRSGGSYSGESSRFGGRRSGGSRYEGSSSSRSERSYRSY